MDLLGKDTTVLMRQRVRQWRKRSAIAVVVVIALIASALIFTVRRGGGGNGWKTVWTDDFAGSAGARPSAANWLTDTGTSYPGGAAAWGTGEVESYTQDRANVALDGDGHLRITAIRDANGAWTSGRLETTRTNFQPAPGHTLKVEARIKAPRGGQGYWPAFWMLGNDFRGTYSNWPRVGEIDVFENIGREQATVHGTLHCGLTPGGPCDENNGIGGAYSMPDGSPVSAEFHTYGIEWDRSGKRDEIRWYFDGHRYFTVHAADVDPATWANATRHGYFLLLNLAVGGTWPGAPDVSTRSGAAMLVDSVSVSSR
jgi:beta-glucanase (GH16 family)